MAAKVKVHPPAAADAVCSCLLAAVCFVAKNAQARRGTVPCGISKPGSRCAKSSAVSRPRRVAPDRKLHIAYRHTPPPLDATCSRSASRRRSRRDRRERACFGRGGRYTGCRARRGTASAALSTSPFRISTAPPDAPAARRAAYAATAARHVLRSSPRAPTWTASAPSSATGARFEQRGGGGRREEHRLERHRARLAQLPKAPPSPRCRSRRRRRGPRAAGPGRADGHRELPRSAGPPGAAREATATRAGCAPARARRQLGEHVLRLGVQDDVLVGLGHVAPRARDA